MGYTGLGARVCVVDTVSRRYLSAVPVDLLAELIFVRSILRALIVIMKVSSYF